MIQFANLHICGYEGKLPLNQADVDSNFHIHGALSIGGKPIEGYDHENIYNDVCFVNWVGELTMAYQQFSEGDGKIIIDDGEVDTAVYFLEKKGDSITLYNDIEGAYKNYYPLNAINISFSWIEFQHAYQQFRKNFLNYLKLMKVKQIVYDEWEKLFD